ncbi:hypothetical protein D3C86_1349160 [compost metagenome]
MAALALPGVTLRLPKASATMVRLAGPQLPLAREASSLTFEVLRYWETKVLLPTFGLTAGLGAGCGAGFGFGFSAGLGAGFGFSAGFGAGLA